MSLHLEYYGNYSVLINLKWDISIEEKWIDNIYLYTYIRSKKNITNMKFD